MQNIEKLLHDVWSYQDRYVGIQFRNCLEVFNDKNYIVFQTHKTKIAPLFQLNAPSWEFRVWQLIYQDSVVSWGTKLVILNHMVSTLLIVCIKASVTSVMELKGADFISLMYIFTLKIISTVVPRPTLSLCSQKA